MSRRRRNNAVVLARLQLWLLGEIFSDENSVKGLKAVAEQKGLRLDGEEASTIEGEAAKLRNAIGNGLQFHRTRANCVRQIGDGIAWRAFGYDRAVMRLLSQRATKQHMSAEGTVHELQEWARTFDGNEGIAILNAVTNVLAVGDITVAKQDGSGEIIEVKSSKGKSRRVTRQKQKMREVVKLLNFGRGEIEAKELTILRFDTSPENDLKALLDLLDRASNEGWSAARINDCCYVECINMAALKSSKDIIANFEASRAAETTTFLTDGDYVSELTSLDILAFTPNCMPFSIFPFPPKRCIELMTGIASFKSFFNVSAFFRALQRSGWTFNRGPDQIAAESGGFATPVDTVGEVEKDGLRITIPPGYITKMKIEMLRPSVIIRELDEVRKLGVEDRPQWNMILNDREPEIWD